MPISSCHCSSGIQPGQVTSLVTVMAHAFFLLKCVSLCQECGCPVWSEICQNRQPRIPHGKHLILSLGVRQQHASRRLVSEKDSQRGMTFLWFLSRYLVCSFCPHFLPSHHQLCSTTEKIQRAKGTGFFPQNRTLLYFRSDQTLVDILSTCSIHHPIIGVHGYDQSVHNEKRCGSLEFLVLDSLCTSGSCSTANLTPFSSPASSCISI